MGMLKDDADARIVEQIIGLAHAFALEVVAEGVESAEVAEKLVTLDCDSVQGFHYAKPLRAPELPGWAKDWRAAHE